MTMIEEMRRLDRCVDVASLSFDDIMRALRGYAGSELLSEDGARRLGLDTRLLAQLRDLLARVGRRRDPDPAQCQADRVAAWQLQMSLPGESMPARLAEIVVLCTYDRESAEFDTFGPEAMLESIMTSLSGLGEGFCRGFVDTVIDGRPRDRQQN